MSEIPAFRIFNPETGKEYRIYASGRIEGFEDMEPRCISNRIPQLIAEAVEASTEHIEPKPERTVTW